MSPVEAIRRREGGGRAPTPGCSARSTRTGSTSTRRAGSSWSSTAWAARPPAARPRTPRRRCSRRAWSARPVRSPGALREAIAIANNEIHRLRTSRPEWDGMACVLTAVVIRQRQRDGRPRRRHAALQAAPRPDREGHPRSLAGRRARRRAARSPSSTRCSTRAATRCIATWARSRTSPRIRISSTSRRSRSSPTPPCSCAATA